MEGKDHARIHTGRNDCNARPRGSRRRTALGRRSPPAQNIQAAFNVETWQTYACTCEEEGWWWCPRHAETEAGDEGLDGLHPNEA